MTGPHGGSMGWRRMLASNGGTLMALVLVFWLTVGGVLQLAMQYQSVRDDVTSADIEKLRVGFTALDSMISLADNIDQASRDGWLSEELRNRLSVQLDRLIEQSRAFNIVNTGDQSAVVQDVRDALVEVLSIGDTALARDGVDLAELELRGTVATYQAKRALLAYFDTIHEREMAATLAKNKMLNRLTLTAAGLLLVFCVICFGAVMLFRAEVAARLREQAAEHRARFLAYYDPLTKLANRTMFNDVAERRLASDEPTMVLLIDLDEFKAVNDTLGHAAGDVLLRTVAQRIGAVVAGVGGMAARLGGDEFAALVPHLGSRARVEALCDAVIERIVEPLEIEGNSVTPGASIGLSGLLQTNDDQAVTLSHLLHQADFALYASKRAGRGRYTLFDHETWQVYNSRRMVQDALPRAVASEEFFLLYQPQVELTTGQVFGLEALVRWRHDGQVLTPGMFLPIAEESGVILRIDDFVLREATRQTARWNSMTDEALSISVNLSALNFQNEEIVSRVADALAHSGLPPALLTLEMTETVLIEDWKKVSSILAQLHALGVRVALDDFGTGYSSLAYLRQLQVDEVKIDRSFVQEVETSSQTRFILDAIADIARGLRMRIMVEGLETAEQVSIVRGFGCTAGQGFHFGPLLRRDEIESRLTAAGRIHVNPSGGRKPKHPKSEPAEGGI